jgi:hypothetical protein
LPLRGGGIVGYGEEAMRELLLVEEDPWPPNPISKTVGDFFHPR